MTERLDPPHGAERPPSAPFAAAVQVVDVSITISDPRQPDNPVVFVNDAFCRLTGYTQPEVLGRNFRFMQGPETDPAAVARIRAAIAAGTPIEIDIRNHRKDGTPFWNRLVITPDRDAAGVVTHFIASQTDVTLELERLPTLQARNDALLAALAERVTALDESEARFRQMADNAPVMVWTTDTSGDCTWLSRSWSAFTGRALADGLGQGWRDSIHPDDRQAVEQAFKTALATDGPIQREYQMRRADASYAWVIDAAAPRRAEDGTPMGYVGSILDITDRRTTEARLELSEQSLRLATDAAAIGTWDLDLATGLLTASERTKVIFGLPPHGPFDVRDLRASVHPADEAARAAAFRAVIDAEIRADYDVEYRTIGRHDGVHRWVSANGKGLFTGDGRCTRAMGTVIDVTARKAAHARQTALLTLGDQVRAMTDARTIADATRAILGAHFSTPHAGFVAVDPAEAAAFEGTNNGADEPGAVLAACRPAMRSALAAGRTLLCGQDGIEPCTVAGLQTLLIVPLLRKNGLVGLLYIGCAQEHFWSLDDLTLVEHMAARAWDAMERSRAETALRELNATLESRVEERTAELRQAEEALRQAHKMEAVGQLTGGIAHDFNNLLTGIVGALDLLQRRLSAGRTDGLQRYSAMAMTSAQRAGALTQRLLAFARRQPLDPRPTDTNRLVADMEALLRRTLGPQVALEMALDHEVWPSLCDANQLESAILSLAINARDAMPDGGRLRIETANVDLDATYARAQGGGLRPGPYTVVSVTDTGTGMTPDILARVFDPFFTTKPIGQGTGLGLSMLYGFAKQSDGHVSVASEPGMGAQFRLFLPRHHGAPAAAGPIAQPVARPRHGRGTVLVVDDENAIRMLVVETLEEHGFSVLQASDGPAGLQILQAGAPVDLLVTDVGLPGLDGRQVADAARALRPGLQVLFITGYTHDAAIGNTELDAGMAMMTKPFAMNALAEKIHAMIPAG